MVGIADEAPGSGIVSWVLLRGIFSTELKVVYVNNPSIARPIPLPVQDHLAASNIGSVTVFNSGTTGAVQCKGNNEYGQRY